MIRAISGKARRRPDPSLWTAAAFWAMMLLIVAGIIAGGIVLTTTLLSGSDKVSIEQTEEVNSFPEVIQNPLMQAEPSISVPATIPILQVEWQELGLEDPSPTEGFFEAARLVPTDTGVYAVNTHDFTTWQYLEGAWTNLGRAKFDGSGFQLGDIEFPAYDPYVGVFIRSHAFQYEHAEIRENLKNILGEEAYNRGNVTMDGLAVALAKPRESWMVANIAPDPANPQIVAMHVWQIEEIGRPVPPTPHLYLSTDNRQT